MAQIIRSAKCGSDWTINELAAYNISVVPETIQEFFGTPNLPACNRPSLLGFMSTEDRQFAPDNETRKLLHYLDLALDPKGGQEAAITTLVTKLLEELGYDDGDRIIFPRRTLPFLICGIYSSALTDVCLMNDHEILLVVQVEDRRLSFKDPEPQVIAEAIAAFALNNKVRADSQRLPPLAAATIPAIIMVGTKPVFYKIRVTAELSTAVASGVYPDHRTLVSRYVPDLPRRHSLGMRPLQNRAEILACFEAFKQFLAV